MKINKCGKRNRKKKTEKESKKSIVGSGTHNGSQHTRTVGEQWQHYIRRED